MLFHFIGFYRLIKGQMISSLFLMAKDMIKTHTHRKIIHEGADDHFSQIVLLAMWFNILYKHNTLFYNIRKDLDFQGPYVVVFFFCFFWGGGSRGVVRSRIWSKRGLVILFILVEFSSSIFNIEILEYSLS